jgi:hypothetical protein
MLICKIRIISVLKGFWTAGYCKFSSQKRLYIENFKPVKNIRGNAGP